MDSTDAQEAVEIDTTAVAAALQKLAAHPEPEARFMRTAGGKVPACNVQTAVDAEHALPDHPGPPKIVADAGYSNGEQARACAERGIEVHVPANRGSTITAMARRRIAAPSPATR